jgi:hypothetical protein
VLHCFRCIRLLCVTTKAPDAVAVLPNEQLVLWQYIHRVLQRLKEFVNEATIRCWRSRALRFTMKSADRRCSQTRVGGSIRTWAEGGWSPRWRPAPATNGSSSWVRGLPVYRRRIRGFVKGSGPARTERRQSGEGIHKRCRSHRLIARHSSVTPSRTVEMRSSLCNPCSFRL